MPAPAASSRPPTLLRLAALVALITTASAALGFQLGASRAYHAVEERRRFADEQPVLVARAGALARALSQEGVAPDERVRRQADLGRVLSEIEAAHQALVLLADVEQWEGDARGVSAALIGDADAPLRAFVADGRTALSAMETWSRDFPLPTSLAAPEALGLIDRLERVAALYADRQKDVTARSALFAMIAWWAVLATAASAAVTLVLPTRHAPSKERLEPRFLDDAAERRGSPRRAEAPARLDPAPSPPAKERRPRAHGPSQAGRTLVCIRSYGLREAVSDRLRALGLDVEATALAEEAQSAVEAQAYRLFVVDGAAAPLARRLKASVAPAHAGCVAIAQSWDDERALRGSGADVVVACPLAPMELETAAAFAIGALPATRAA